MEYSNISYHTRLHSDNSKKIIGGSFGGNCDIDTINRLVNAHFNINIKNSGIAVFVDKELQEVDLYIKITPTMSDKGKQLIKNHYKELQKIENDKKKKLQSLLDCMDDDELLERLQAKDYY